MVVVRFIKINFRQTKMLRYGAVSKPFSAIKQARNHGCELFFFYASPGTESIECSRYGMTGAGAAPQSELKHLNDAVANCVPRQISHRV